MWPRSQPRSLQFASLSFLTYIFIYLFKLLEPYLHF
jgi:hypothetical protein